VNQGKLEVKNLRSFARKLRYLAEDWAPLNEPMPDILQKEPVFMAAGDEESVSE
jgi:hypothetical protein